MQVYMSNFPTKEAEGNQVIEYNVDSLDIVNEKYTIRIRISGIEVFERNKVEGLVSISKLDIDLTEPKEKKNGKTS